MICLQFPVSQKPKLAVCKSYSYSMFNQIYKFAALTSHCSTLPNRAVVGTNDKLAALVNKVNGRRERQLAALRKKSNDKMPLKKVQFLSPMLSLDKLKKYKKFPHYPTIHVQSTRNNTLLTLTDAAGSVVKGGWASGGSTGFKNSRKSSAQASVGAVKNIARSALSHKIFKVLLRVKGIGRTKGVCLRALKDTSLKILAIQECTPQVHNGCRAAKKRRI